MSAKTFSHLTPRAFLWPLVVLWFVFGEAFAQQFPIGTYWVRTDRERHDQYGQVASAGININVGGHYGTSTLPNILAAAEANNLALIIDHTSAPAAGTDSILWYGGGNSQYDDIRAYRMEYESTGYASNSQLQTMEAPIIYNFTHDVGGDEIDLNTLDGFAWRADPPTAGLMIYSYSGTDWQHPSYTYRATFRMKIADNSSHVLVATIRVVQGTNPPFVQQQIYSDNFTANQVYQEFEYQFTTPGLLGSSSESALEEIKSMLPEGSISSPAQIDLDYQVEYHGNRILWVDYVAIENGWGDRLFDGSKDTDLRNEAQWAYNQDLGNPNIQGFYTDEPEITRLAPMRYVNDLLGPIAPARFGYRETMKSTVLFHHIFSQYLNTGQSLNRDYKLLVDYYPLEYGALRPGDAGYNNYVQGRWENQLIPALRNARLASSFNNKSYWYAIQAHSWDFPGSRLARDPHPNEMRCMVYLGLAYGAKGVFYFLYTSIPAGTPGYVGALGLVDNNFSHSYEPYLSKWNMVQQINGNLQLLATDLLSLNWQSAFTPSAGDPVPSGSLVQNVIGGNAGGNYVEVGNFTHSTSGEQYFMLVNRRCEIADVQTVTVILTNSGSLRLIEDVLASRVPWDGNANRVAYRTLQAGNNTFTVTLNPGEGRLFRITSGLSGNLTGNRYWSGTPYVLNNLTVNSGVTSTLSSETTVTIASGATITVQGTLSIPSNVTISGGGTIVTSGSGKIYVTSSADATAYNNSRKLVRDSAGNYHLVFESDGEICYEKWTNNGTALSEFRRLSSGTGSNKFPSIAERSGKFYVFWQRKTGTNTYDTHFRHFTGTSWDNIRNINTGIASNNDLTPALAASTPAASFEMMVVYRTNQGLRFRRSTSSTGATWDAAATVTSNTSARNPSLVYKANDYGYFNLTWDEGNNIYHQIYYGGTTWGAATTVSNGTSAYNHQYSSYALSGNNDRHIVWQAFEAVDYQKQAVYHNKNLTNVFTVFASTSWDHLKPSGTGHTAGGLTVLCHDSNNNIRKRYYNGSYWQSGLEGTVIASNNLDVSASIANPPGALAEAVWRSSGSAPYTLTIGPSGGLSKSAADENWVYHRRVVFSLKNSATFALQMGTAQLLSTRGRNQQDFPVVSDQDSIKNNDLTAALQLSGILLPSDADSLVFEAVVYGQDAGNLRGDQSKSIDLAFNLLSAETGLPLASIQLARLNNTGTSRQAARLVFPVQTLRGRRVHLAPALSNVNTAKLNGALIHVYEAVADGTQKARTETPTLVAAAQPTSFSVRVYPNPFNPSTQIYFYLPAEDVVTVQIYDVNGRIVRELSHGLRKAGDHSVTWDGRDELGRIVASGMYFTHVRFGEERKVAKMMLVQ